LLLGYSAHVRAALVLSAAQVWHFWLAASLVLVAMGIHSTIAPAYATDLLAPRALSRGLSWLNTTQFLASILTFTGSGLLVGRYGSLALALVATLLPLIAFLLLGASSWVKAPAQILSSEVELEPGTTLQPCV
jgi:MFS family permease